MPVVVALSQRADGSGYLLVHAGEGPRPMLPVCLQELREAAALRQAS